MDKVFDKGELNIKVLKCLDRSLKPKVTTILESEDLSRLSTTALFRKLREHELQLNRIKEQESSENKVKIIALKSIAQKKELSEDEEDLDQVETLSLLTKKFNKFLKKKNRERFQPKKINSFKHNESSSSNFTFFICGKLGHIKVDFPKNQSKDKSLSRKAD